MSSRLEVEVDVGPLDRTRADVAVVYFFDSDRPLRGGAGRADWRLCGRISRLIVAGKLAGGTGEAVLIPTEGGLAAPLVIGLGIGARNLFDVDRCEALGCEAVDRARRLGARTVALPLPDPEAGDLDLSERIEALVTGALRALADVSVELRLRLVPPASEAARAQKLVRQLELRRRPPSVSLHLGGAPTRVREVDPHGVAGSVRSPRQTIK